MDPPLHSRVKSAVSWVDSSRWKLSKATKDANISRQGFGLCILGCPRYFVHRLPWERKNHHIEYYIALMVCLKEEITKQWPQMKEKKVLFYHCVTNRLQWWQNYMNCTSNCFRTHLILKIWPPATTGCLQTSKECSRERDLAPKKK